MRPRRNPLFHAERRGAIQFLDRTSVGLETSACRGRLCRGSSRDKVVDEFHHLGWCFDLREVPYTGKHFKPAVRTTAEC